jgi:hypothetical protein
MGTMCVASRTKGDVKITWDPKNKEEVAAAEKAFDDLIAKGHLAYDTSDEKDRKAIKKFNAKAGEIVIAPPLTGG